ncbi:MAG: cyclic nucleotide-binding domain-containing protein [Myxococcales bacterium]
MASDRAVKQVSSDVNVLRARWDTAVLKGRHDDALEVLLKLEPAEPREPRWTHRIADTYRRLGRAKEAEAAYERALTRYLAEGFLPQAVAMAKLVLALNPARTDVVERVKPDQARALRGPARLPLSDPAPPRDAVLPPPSPVASHASLPQRATRVIETPVLAPADDEADDEVRFSEVDRATSFDIDVSELDVAPSPEVLDAERLSMMAACTLFADVPRQALKAMTEAAELVELEGQVVLFREGDSADSLYAVIEGAVRVEVSEVPEGATIGKGELVGEGCILDGAVRTATVRVDGHLVALRIPKASLTSLVETDPRVGAVLLQLFLRRLIGTYMQTSPLFKPFEPSMRLEIARTFEVRRAPSRTHLTERGRRSDGLYLVLAGKISVVDGPGEGSTLPVGTVFGQRSLLGRTVAERTLVTVSECLVLRLPAQKFASFAVTYPPALAFLSELDLDEAHGGAPQFSAGG